ncbi:g2340 [Coccomyxa viridis]|uniref:G2340 protein n=1 Tax=Coccomyxa viridis TaxID=1274662 RepID=A0ABP1FK41_9CHLO
MESTPYVQPTRQRRRCQWRRSSENSLGHADLHATPDVLWGSQAPSGTFGERLTAVDGCLGDWRPSEMHRQSRMELDSTIDMEDPLTSPPSPCARHPSMPSRVRLTRGEDEESACDHWPARDATVFGTSPGNTPMPKRMRRSLASVAEPPEPPRKHGTPDAIPCTPFEFVSGVRGAQTCPGKDFHRLQQAPAKQHRVKAVRRTLDLRNAPGTVLQSRKEPGWRMRRPLIARAKMGRARCLPSPDLLHRHACRPAVETPAPLFSLAEAEATLQPGEPQGYRGLPPLATSLRKRIQEEDQQQANRKLRAVQTPSQGMSTEEGCGGNSWGDKKMHTERIHSMGLSPSARMAGLRLRD